MRRRAFVMGIVAAAGSVGGVCFPMIFDQLAKIPSIGFAWSLRAVAIIVAYVEVFSADPCRCQLMQEKILLCNCALSFVHNVPRRAYEIETETLGFRGLFG